MGEKMSNNLHDAKQDFGMFVIFACFVIANITSFFYVKNRFAEIKYQMSVENLGIITVFRYTNLEKCTDSDPNITASGDYVQEGFVALSQDFFNEGKVMFGDCVQINGKKYVVKDKMHKRIKRSADIFQYKKTGLNGRETARLYLIK